jgi:hypothetical protein
MVLGNRRSRSILASQDSMNSSKPRRRLPVVTAIALICFVSGCTIFSPRPKGQIVVQAVSWTLVKKYAERDAGLPGHKVVIQNAQDQSVVAEQTTDATGIVVFDVPAGNYLVLGAGGPPESVAVDAGETVKLKLVVH